MDPVSNANKIAMLLRQRLQERARSGGAGAAGRKQSNPAGDPVRAGALHGAAAVGALDDRRLKRALIEKILSDQFGAAMINDARFQQVVDQVTDTIDEDEEGAALLSRAVADLRADPA